MRIYVHREAAHEAEAIETVETAIIGEVLEIDDEIVLLEDAEAELDVEKSFEDAAVGDRAHVFRGTRSRVVAEVLFNGQRIEREFPVSARVEQVFRWATGHQGFDLSKADAAEHTLELPDGTVPHGDVHLGSLDDATPGRVAFNLVPKHRFEG